MGGELRAGALERAPRLEELGDVDGVEVEQDVHGLAEVACDGIGVGAVDERAAAAAGHGPDEPDVDQRSQRLADGGAADLKPAGLLGLGGEPVPRTQLAGRDGLHDREPHLVDRAHDGGRAEGAGGRLVAVRHGHRTILWSGNKG